MMIFECGTIRYNMIRHDKPGGLNYSIKKKNPSKSRTRRWNIRDVWVAYQLAANDFLQFNEIKWFHNLDKEKNKHSDKHLNIQYHTESSEAQNPNGKRN